MIEEDMYGITPSAKIPILPNAPAIATFTLDMIKSCYT